MPLSQGYRAAYIGRWDEPEPSDQTDSDLRRRLDLNGSGRLLMVDNINILYVNK
jgi:hypothetical protein